MKKANAIPQWPRCSIFSNKRIQYAVDKLYSMYSYSHSCSEKLCYNTWQMRVTETIFVLLSKRGTVLFLKRTSLVSRSGKHTSQFPFFYRADFIACFYKTPAQVLESNWLRLYISWVLLHPYCWATNLPTQRNRKFQPASVSLPKPSTVVWTMRFLLCFLSVLHGGKQILQLSDCLPSEWTVLYWI